MYRHFNGALGSTTATARRVQGSFWHCLSSLPTKRERVNLFLGLRKTGLGKVPIGSMLLPAT